MERSPESGSAVPLETWEGCGAPDLANYWGLPAVHLFERVGSTNDVARRLAHDGAPAGTLVIAEEQTTGRGRGAHSWSSPPGVGLWCSFVLRGITTGTIGLLPIRVALVVAEAVDPWTGRGVGIKWPNDLLLGGRKFGGILCEASWDGQSLDHVVVGVGLNLVHGPEDFPEGLRDDAISLRIFSGTAVSRFEVASAVATGVRSLATGPWPSQSSVVESFAARDALAGRTVDVRNPDTQQLILSGLDVGIDREGALLLRRADGAVLPVRSGTVRLAQR